MAFSAITTAEITTGEPTTTTTATKIKDNFDDHESRIASLETTSILLRPIEFWVKGQYESSSSLTGLLYTRLTFNITLSAGRLVLLDTGTSGTLTVDIQFKRGASAFASIFSVLPTLTSAAAQFDVNAGTLSTTSFLNGDILRLDITSVMAGNTEFMVQLDQASS